MNQLNHRINKRNSINQISYYLIQISWKDNIKSFNISSKKRPLSKTKKNCIYGLDADLIMLSLVSGLKDIVLLRERTSFNIEQMDCEYLYLDIHALEKEILNEFPNRQIAKQTIIYDYCFICFLLGNDFMKHSPSLILRYDGHIIW